MASVHVERLDHLGLIACMIKDVGLISMIDARLVPDEQEEITPGEAVAGMILNGLGFANRPLSLTPQQFPLLTCESHATRVADSLVRISNSHCRLLQGLFRFNVTRCRVEGSRLSAWRRNCPPLEDHLV